MKVINLTPHSINIENGVVIGSSGVCRVAEETRQVDDFDGIPVYETTYTNAINLPDETDDTVYIVSLPVALALPQRKDLYTPAIMFRDNKGRIAGCKGVQRVIGFSAK